MSLVTIWCNCDQRATAQVEANPLIFDRKIPWKTVTVYSEINTQQSTTKRVFKFHSNDSVTVIWFFTFIKCTTRTKLIKFLIFDCGGSFARWRHVNSCTSYIPQMKLSPCIVSVEHCTYVHSLPHPTCRRNHCLNRRPSGTEYIVCCHTWID